MTSHLLPTIDPTRFRLPAIRHLAWMCTAPQLTDSALAFDLSSHLPANTLDLLRGWESLPHTAPQSLREPAQPRLGYYFERLYESLLTDVLGWNVLVRNLPIRSPERTLGELDFVVRNPVSGEVEHHEIAIKFYLGYGGDEAIPAGWYGPNAVDRLDLKTTRMLEYQSQRTRLHESIAALAELGIQAPLTSRVFMPGYLFYPRGTDLATPAGVPVDHQRGSWMYLESVADMDVAHWTHLRKPHWLGPWIQASEPDPVEARSVLEQIGMTQTPRLFARMGWHAQSELWVEAERIFVVPARWPG